VWTNQLWSKLGFDYKNKKVVLITCHRRENLGVGIIEVCKAIRELAKKFSDVQYVFPVHLNPSILDPTTELLAGIPNVHLVQPLDYELFVHLMACCHLVLTDSGGIQEEAPSLGKPVLVIRDVTERPEAVQAGTVKMIGSDESAIILAVAELLNNTSMYDYMAKAVNPYGDGKACDRIVSFLETV
jgi:UDP-N-acetylglucosamine 2-epimerase (non-hydrolysing)